MMRSSKSISILVVVSLLACVQSVLSIPGGWDVVLTFDDEPYVVRGWNLAPDESALYAVHGDDLRLAKFDFGDGMVHDSGTTQVLHIEFPELYPNGVFLRQSHGDLVAGLCEDFSTIWSAPLTGYYEVCADYGACLMYGEVGIGLNSVIVQTALHGTFRIHSLTDGNLIAEVPIPTEPLEEGREKIRTVQRIISFGMNEALCLCGSDWNELEASCHQMAILSTGDIPIWPLFHIEERLVRAHSIAHHKNVPHLAIPTGGQVGWPYESILDTEYRILVHRANLNGIQIKEIDGFNAPVTALAYSADGRYLVAASGDQVYFFDVQGNYALVELPVTLNTGGKDIFNILVTNDLSRLIVRTGGIFDGVISVWEPSNI